MNRRSLERLLQTSSQDPGSTESWLAGMECKSLYKECGHVRMAGQNWVVQSARPRNGSRDFFEQ